MHLCSIYIYNKNLTTTSESQLSEAPQTMYKAGGIVNGIRWHALRRTIRKQKRPPVKVLVQPLHSEPISQQHPVGLPLFRESLLKNPSSLQHPALRAAEDCTWGACPPSAQGCKIPRTETPRLFVLAYLRP